MKCIPVIRFRTRLLYAAWTALCRGGGSAIVTTGYHLREMLSLAGDECDRFRT